MATPASETPEELMRWLCDTLALVCHRAPGSVGARTGVLDLDLDSLTFASVLARAETAYGLELSSEDMLSLLEAADVGALAGALAAIIRSRRKIVDAAR